MKNWFIKRKNELLIFFGIIVCKFLFFFVAADYGINPDRIGDLIAPTKLAGLDWDLLIQKVYYYGYGFKWLYAPFFALTDNPDIIYYGILSFYNVLYAFLGVMIYHLEVKYLKIQSKAVAVLLAVFMGILMPADMKSEPSLYIMGWVIFFIIAKAISIKDSKSKIIYGIILAVGLSYCLTLHERMVTIIIGFCIVVVLYRFVFKEWFVNPFVYFPTQLVLYKVVNWCNDLYRAYFWHTSDVKNSDVIPEDASLYFFKSLEGFRIAVKCIWSNFMTLGTQTYGLAWLAVAFLLLSIAAICKKQFSKETDTVDRILFTFIWLGGICVAIVMAGLVMRWGIQVYNGEVYGYKGFVYGRYYVNFAYPAILAVIVWLISHPVKKSQIIFFWCCVLLLSAGFLFKIFPTLELANQMCIPTERISTTSIEWILFEYILKSKSVKFNLFLNLIVIFGFLAAVSWKLLRGRRIDRTISCIMGVVIFFVIMGNTDHFQFAKPSVIFSGGAYEGTYEFFKDMEAKGISVKDKTIYSDTAPWPLQYELNRYRISYLLEQVDDSDDGIIVSCNVMDGVKEHIAWKDYYYVNVTDFVKMYFRDNGLADTLKEKGYEVTPCTDGVVIEIPGLSDSFEFVVSNDLQLIVPDDEVGDEYKELVAQRRQELTGATGTYASDLWLDMAKKIDGENADLVVFAGDMVDYASKTNIQLLKQGMDLIREPIVYIRSDHDYSRHYTADALSENEVDTLQSELLENPDLWDIEYPEFILLGINNSWQDISKETLSKIKNIVGKNKPIVVITHVPYDSPIDSSLREASYANRNHYNMWGVGDRYEPDENTAAFMELLYDENSPVVAVIAAHLHFPYEVNLSSKVKEYICAPSYEGTYTKVRLVRAKG